MIRGSVTYLTTFPLVALLAHNVLFFEHPWCFSTSQILPQPGILFSQILTMLTLELSSDHC